METAKKFEYPENFIKYLGTSGGRFSMIRQLRSTGGLWFRYGGVQGVIDPGPGSLAHICAARPALEIASADVVMLTHKHIDHSTDVNVVIEGMTHGGFDSRGMLVAPDDALRGNDPVVLKYSQKRIPKIKIPEEGGKIELGNGVVIEPVIHLHHGVDCFGYIFRKEGLREWGIISDSRMMPYFRSRYSACAFISINATFPDRKPRLDHISIAEARELLARRTDAPRRNAYLRRRRALPRKPRPAGDEAPRRDRRHDGRPRYTEGIRGTCSAARRGILGTIAGRDNSDNGRDAHRQDRDRAAADGKI